MGVEFDNYPIDLKQNLIYTHQILVQLFKVTCYSDYLLNNYSVRRIGLFSHSINSLSFEGHYFYMTIFPFLLPLQNLHFHHNKLCSIKHKFFHFLNLKKFHSKKFFYI